MREKKTDIVLSFVCFFIILVVDIFTLVNNPQVIFRETDPVYSAAQVNAVLSNTIFGKSFWYNLNGTMIKLARNRSMYKSDGVTVSTRGYVFGAYPQTSTDYEISQLSSFKEYLDEEGVQLLYVNEPLKYTDDFETYKEFGLRSYGNANADLLLQRAKKAGVEMLDLRQQMNSEGISGWDLFYRTDHHWTVPAGLWAARTIAVKMSELGVAINLDIYDEDLFSHEEYKDAWLGEQGKKVSVSYIGLDDYTYIEPVQEQDFSVKLRNGEVLQGGFDILVDQTRFNTDLDVYQAKSWHYAYLPFKESGLTIENHHVKEGRILYLGDSYDYVVVPFLAMGVNKLDFYIIRDMDMSVRDLIESGDYDMVVVAYAQFMIGAHDNENSVNYNMFNFE